MSFVIGIVNDKGQGETLCTMTFDQDANFDAWSMALLQELFHEHVHSVLPAVVNHEALLQDIRRSFPADVTVDANVLHHQQFAADTETVSLWFYIDGMGINMSDEGAGDELKNALKNIGLCEYFGDKSPRG